LKKIIAYCGIICSECPAFIATQNNDEELRAKTAKKWATEYNPKMQPKDIFCDGCLAETGVLFFHCLECEIRKCCLEKNIENCALCDQFPCQKISDFFKFVPDAKATLEKIRNK